MPKPIRPAVIFGEGEYHQDGYWLYLEEGSFKAKCINSPDAGGYLYIWDRDSYVRDRSIFKNLFPAFLLDPQYARITFIFNKTRKLMACSWHERFQLPYWSRGTKIDNKKDDFFN